MSNTIWDRFFWSDWENDPALKLTSLAAQGLWMRMLCICAKAEPKGYLVVAGQPLTPADLASIVGKPEQEVERLLGELSDKGVFSRDRKSTIYSRRILRDINKSKTAQKNGGLGGNPRLCNNSAISASDNLSDKAADKPHIPISNSIKPEEIRASFEEFWLAYPKRDGANPKAPAEKIFFRLAKSGVDPAAIVAGAKRCAEKESKNIGTPYIPRATTFLNERRWEDYNSMAIASLPSREDQEKAWRFALEYQASKGFWDLRSPEPGSRDCKIPKDFIEQWKQERAPISERQ